MAENFKTPPIPTAPRTTGAPSTAPRGAVPPRATGMSAQQQTTIRQVPMTPRSTIAPKTQPTRAPMTQAPRQAMSTPQMRQQRPASAMGQQTRVPTPAQQMQPRQAPQQATQGASAPRSAVQQTQQEENFAQYYGLPEWILGPKALPAIAFGVCIFGFLLGSMLSGKPSQPASRASGGQQWVVRNTDLSKPYPRCGRVARGRACILYIMNNTEYDKKAQNFFDEANRLTGVSQHHIELANPTYAKTLIPGGYLVEIKIPDLM